MNRRSVSFLLSLLAVFVFGTSSVFAWNNPSQNPANGGGSLVAEQNSPASVIYIKSDGNVGIGSVNPTRKLLIYDASVPRMGIDGPAGAEPGYELYSAGTLSSMVYRPASTNDLRFYVGVDRMTILSGGNVGIGTTSPTTKLEVSGTVKASGFEGPLTGTIGAPNVSAGAFGANTGGGNYSFPALVNHIGGDNSLSVYGPNASWGAYLAVGAAPSQITTQKAQLVTTDGNLHLDSAIGHATYINYYSQASTYINPQGGNVGIRTTNPTSPLYVNASAHNGAAMVVDRYASGGTPSIQAGPSNEYLMLEGAGTTGRVGINYYSSGNILLGIGGGNVGISTANPLAKLHIANGSSNGIMMTYDASGNYRNSINNYYVDGNAAGNYMQFLVSNGTASGQATSMTLLGNGNVGIGNTNPGAKLDVGGTAYIPQMFVNRSSAAGRGISWYSPTYTAWADYMCNAGQTNCGPTANITTPAGTLVTSWGRRSFIENVAGYGWTFESGSATGQPSVVAEISSSDGSAKFNGTVTATGFSGPITGTVAAGNVSSGSFGSGTGGGDYTFPANLTVSGSKLGSARLGTLGYSGGDYGTVGYGYNTTGSSGVYNYGVNDTASQIRFGSGGFTFNTAPAGTTGNSITFTPAMTILQSGKVGIGTTSPFSGAYDTKLDLHAVNYPGLVFSADNANADRWTIGQDISGTISMLKFMDEDEGRVVLSLQDDGNVGIGTMAPSRKLHVVGAIAADTLESGSAADPLEINYYTGAPTKICATASCGVVSAYFAPTTGYVGIGNTNPGARLHITGTNSENYLTLESTSTAPNVYSEMRLKAGSRSAYLFMMSEGSTNYGGDGALNLYSESGPVLLHSAGTEKVRVTTGGYVGIGSTNPGTRLEVKGGHVDTTMRLYSIGDGGTNDAYLNFWASEPGVTYTGAGIGNNIAGSPYYGRVNGTRGASYIRFLDNAMLFNTISSAGANVNVMSIAPGNTSIQDSTGTVVLLIDEGV